MPTPGALFDIQFDGIRQLEACLNSIEVLLDRNLRVAVTRTVLWGAGQIAEDCPVDTGLLRASIGGMVVDTAAGGKNAAAGRGKSLTSIDGLTGIIGTAVHYAIYQEFGFTATGPKKLTPKQLRFLFATGILKAGPGKTVIRGMRKTTQTWYKGNMRAAGRKVIREYMTAGVNDSINRKAGIRTHVKGRGFFRANIPAIRAFFFASCEEAIALALQGKEMQVSA